MVKKCLFLFVAAVFLTITGCSGIDPIQATNTNTRTVTQTEPPITQTVTITPNPATLTATRTATVTVTAFPDTPESYYEITEPVSYQVVEKSGALWRLAWRTSIKNLTGTELLVEVRVDFLSSSGFVLEWAFVPVILKPAEDKTISGEIVSISEKASQIADISLRTQLP